MNLYKVYDTNNLIDYVHHWIDNKQWKYQFADETKVFVSRFWFINYLESLGYNKYDIRYLNQQLLTNEHYHDIRTKWR